MYGRSGQPEHTVSCWRGSALSRSLDPESPMKVSKRFLDPHTRQVLTHPHRLAFVGLLALIVVFPHTARAQSGVDSSTARAPASRRIAIWASLGLGGGSVHESDNGTIGGVFAAHASVGRLLLTYRTSDMSSFFGGPGVRDHALLAGVRTGGRRLFGSAAAGYGLATHYFDFESGTRTEEPRTGVLAYQLALHGNLLVPGLALSYSGALGSSRVTYSALTLALELGWFGR
jgi:hypothetical protein